MTRSQEGADQAVATSPVSIQDRKPVETDGDKRAKCAWGKAERTGEKPQWYLRLFH